MLDHQPGASPLPRHSACQLARGVGWFSIALGAAEVLAPQSLTRWLGLQGSEPVVRAYDLREIGTGIGALTSENPAAWIWGRVAGDVLDAATLAPGLDGDNPKRANVALVIAAVLAVAVADLVCAQSLRRDLQADRQRRSETVRDYSRRSGLKRSPEEMRGAARDFVIPEDIRTPAPLRPYTAQSRTASRRSRQNAARYHAGFAESHTAAAARSRQP